jgi:hypothetical protein
MRRWALQSLAAISTLVAVLLAVAVNAATATLPSFLEDHPGRAWTLVAVLGLVSIGCAVLAVRADEPRDEDGPAGGMRVGGVNAGRDLSLRGQGHTVVGGDQVTPPPRPDSPTARKRQRRC